MKKKKLTQTNLWWNLLFLISSTSEATCVDYWCKVTVILGWFQEIVLFLLQLVWTNTPSLAKPGKQTIMLSKLKQKRPAAASQTLFNLKSNTMISKTNPRVWRLIIVKEPHFLYFEVQIYSFCCNGRGNVSFFVTKWCGLVLLINSADLDF